MLLPIRAWLAALPLALLLGALPLLLTSAAHQGSCTSSYYLLSSSSRPSTPPWSPELAWIRQSMLPLSRRWCCQLWHALAATRRLGCFVCSLACEWRDRYALPCVFDLAVRRVVGESLQRVEQWSGRPMAAVVLSSASQLASSWQGRRCHWSLSQWDFVGALL